MFVLTSTSLGRIVAFGNLRGQSTSAPLASADAWITVGNGFAPDSWRIPIKDGVVMDEPRSSMLGFPGVKPESIKDQFTRIKRQLDSGKTLHVAVDAAKEEMR